MKPNDHDRHDLFNHSAPDADQAHELDAMLRTWHASHRDVAAANRDALLMKIAEQQEQVTTAFAADDTARESHSAATASPRTLSFPAALVMLRSIIMNRYTPAAASLMLLVSMALVFLPHSATPAFAQDREVMMPEGGRLDAFDELGQLVGPCPLQHTDVHVDIASRFSRVTLTQRYRNPYDSKIEAVYTFPLSHRSAVDRMTMTVGDRVVVGEVKERVEARQIYESARAQGYVASLLEQERPNIFTQSVANIEPGAEVVIEISYVETLDLIDGEYSFDFPMVVGPRYIPGSPVRSPGLVPDGLNPRRGAILLGPADATLGEANEVEALGTLQPGTLIPLLHNASAIDHPASHENEWWGGKVGQPQPSIWYPFEVTYADGSKEAGVLLTDGTGNISNRWFFFDINAIENTGSGFAPDTDQVPDASRITPKPVRPPTRAGHDLSLTVSIDTGGPGIVDVESDLHEIIYEDVEMRDDGTPRKVAIALKNGSTIPNRDFVLRWKQTAKNIEEGHFAHTGLYGDYSGGFFTLMLQPPDRVQSDKIVPRELIFVLDTSGSMGGDPIEKSKAVVRRAIQAMRPSDTFNVITFAGHTSVLWDTPRVANADNVAEALRLVDHQQGGGGTEMMKAIDAALRPTHQKTDNGMLTPAQLANLPADGRDVIVRVQSRDVAEILLQDGMAPGLLTIHSDSDDPIDNTFRASVRHWTLNDGAFDQRDDRIWTMRGTWDTEDGKRVFNVSRAIDEPDAVVVEPMRIVMFLTDGYVGNEEAIINQVREFRASTRVFSFGIGNSINRYLLDGMAEAGRGEVEYVLLESDPDGAVERFTKRIESPVLADIRLAFDGIEVIDTIPAIDNVPDLFDVQPLIIHGRYTKPGKGSLTITGRTGAGAYERTIDLDLPERSEDHDVIAKLWARAQIDELTKAEDVAGITNLGVDFQLMTKHTSFVAVEKSRVTVDGEPMLVQVPIELPDGTQWEGFFGGERGWQVPQGLAQSVQWVHQFGVDNALVAAQQWHDQGGTDIAFAALDAVQLATPADARALNLRDGIMIDLLTRQQLADDVARARSLMELGVELEPVSDAAETLSIDVQDNTDTEQSPATRTIETAKADERVAGANIAAATHFAEAEARARQLLAAGNYADSRQEIINARIKLSRAREVIAETDFDRLSRRAGGLIDEIDGIERTGDADADSVQAQRMHDESRQRAERERIILESLREVRRLQLGMEYEKANDVIDEVLFLDENNPSALALKDVIRQNERYLSYLEQQQRKELSILDPPIDVQESLIVTSRSRNDLLAYPEDWRQVSMLRRSDISPDTDVVDVLNSTSVPVDFQNNTVQQVIDFFVQVSGVKMDVDWDALAAQGVQRDDQVNLQLGEVPISHALTHVLADAGNQADASAWFINDGTLVVGSTAPSFAYAPVLDLDTALSFGQPTDLYGVSAVHAVGKNVEGVDAGVPALSAIPKPDSFFSLGVPRADAEDYGFAAIQPNEITLRYNLADVTRAASENMGAATSMYFVQAHTWNLQDDVWADYKSLQEQKVKIELDNGLPAGGGSLFDDPDDDPERMPVISTGTVRVGDTYAADPAAAFRELMNQANDQASAGSGGGGGGGEGADQSAGGSLFDEPDADRVTSADEWRQMLIDTVQEFVAPELWTDFGGESLKFETRDDDMLRAVALDDDPKSQRAAQAANDFIDTWGFVFDPEAVDPPGVSYDWCEAPEDETLLSTLERHILTIDYLGKPVRDVLDDLSRQLGVNVNADWQRLHLIGVKPSDWVTLAKTGTARSILDALAERVSDRLDRAAFRVYGGGIRLTSDDALSFTDRTRIVYDVRDLLLLLIMRAFGGSEEEAAEHLTNVIQDNVDADGWRNYGGETGTLLYANGRLFIRQTPENHRAIQILFAQLRSALAMPISGDDQNRAEHAQQRAWTAEDLEVLRTLRDRRVAVRWNSVPVREALDDLEAKIGIKIDSDWYLQAIDLATDSLTLTTLPVPAGELLEHVAALVGNGVDRPMAMAHDGKLVIADEGRIPRQIDRPTIIYDVRDILFELGEIDEEHGEAYVPTWDLIEMLQEHIGPEQWVDYGGKYGSVQTLLGLFIIQHTPTHHRAIAQWLDELRHSLGLQPRHVQLMGLDCSLPSDHNTMHVFHNVDDIIAVAFARAQARNEAEQTVTEHDAQQAGTEGAPAGSLFDTYGASMRSRFAGIVHAHLADTIMESIAPESWWAVGGEVGAYGSVGGMIAVQHTPDTQIAIERWLNDVRRLYGLLPCANPQLDSVRARALALAMSPPVGASGSTETAVDQNESRIVRLTRVLHDRLWPRVFTATRGGHPIALTVLVDPARDHAGRARQTPADAIRQAGAIVEDVTSDGRIIVIKATGEAIERVAMLDFVRRIEPIVK